LTTSRPNWRFLRACSFEAAIRLVDALAIVISTRFRRSGVASHHPTSTWSKVIHYYNSISPLFSLTISTYPNVSGTSIHHTTVVVGKVPALYNTGHVNELNESELVTRMKHTKSTTAGRHWDRIYSLCILISTSSSFTTHHIYHTLLLIKSSYISTHTSYIHLLCRLTPLPPPPRLTRSRPWSYRRPPKTLTRACEAR
jgi:hypothetical protein